ncbi:MAG: TIGR02453 family protein [Verrucomicrobia bacterium]|nr:TIGR02453 family protein [Verrucomicrobiota bacterium]|tara:strand:+ start:1478 stop:2152 length:675 start_codon:yes stop_codon:yes gene_type:complete
MEKTLNFLKKLKKNNNRDWFQENKSEYIQSNEEMIAFADQLLERMDSFDKIETVSGKKSLYRIYRDVRFSPNKQPYKTNRSGSFRRKGADRRGGYYFSIEPGNTMVGGGFYQPNKEDLELIRRHIEMDADPLHAVLNEKNFKRFYGPLQGEQLKTVPRGFNKEDPNIELLRYKNFYTMHQFSDKDVLADDFVDQVASAYKQLLSYFQVMTDFLTTNLDGESLIG